ncbi:uncharacterized protein L3040_006413 [Drepanopeziza brunnea f. sp. 'multigermtubi']|uniref:uncharacterized protein n=1 Tax=Drepanopeziza brunnea f. sp. 'multigermtubi' TaxID=698441 RepID=UPI00239891BB|nr:hypothetical protein L3040_006413 [Drepanopeziza brunnea f. sp. 'multigermtubi']
MVARSVSLLATFALTANANYFYKPYSPPEPPAPEPYVASPYAGLPKPDVTTSSALPAYSAPKDCEKVRSDCQSQPGANQAYCSALYAQCAGTTDGLNVPAPSSTQDKGVHTTLCPTSSYVVEGDKTHTIYYTSTSTMGPEETYTPYGKGAPVPTSPATEECHAQYNRCRSGSTHFSTCVAQLLSCKKQAMDDYLSGKGKKHSGKTEGYPTPASSDCQAKYDACRSSGSPNLSACVSELEACKSDSEGYHPTQSLQHAPAPSAPATSDCQAEYDSCRSSGSPNLSACVAALEVCQNGGVKSYPVAVPAYTKNTTHPAVMPTHAPVPGGSDECQAEYDSCRSSGSPNLSACVAALEVCQNGGVKSYPPVVPVYTSKNSTKPAVMPTNGPVPSGTSDCQAKYDACRSTGSPNLSACVAQLEVCQNGGVKSYPPAMPIHTPGGSVPSDCQAKYDACRSTGSPNLSACVAQLEVCQNGGSKTYPGLVPMYPKKNSTMPVIKPTGGPVPTGTSGSSTCQAQYDACRSTGSPNLSACVAQFEECQDDSKDYYPVYPPVVKTQDVKVYTTVCPETAYMTYGKDVKTHVYKVTKTLTITDCPYGDCAPTPVPVKSYPIGAPPAMTYPAQGPPAPPAQTYPPQAPPAPPAVNTKDVTVYTTVCPETAYMTYGKDVKTHVYKVTKTLTITSCPGGCEPTPVPVKSYPVEAPPAMTYPAQGPPAPPAQGPPAPPAPPAHGPPAPPAQGPPAPPAQGPPAPPAQAPPAPPAKTYPVEAPPAMTYPAQGPPAPPAQGPPAPPAQGPPAPPAQGPPAPPAQAPPAPPAKTYPVEAPPAMTHPAQGPPAPPAQGPPAPPAQGPPAPPAQGPPAPPAEAPPAPPAKTYPPEAPPAPPAKTYPVEAPPAMTYPAQGPPAPPAGVPSTSFATKPVGTAPGAPSPTASQYTFTGAASTLQVGSVGLLSLAAFVFLL